MTEVNKRQQVKNERKEKLTGIEFHFHLLQKNIYSKNTNEYQFA